MRRGLSAFRSRGRSGFDLGPRVPRWHRNRLPVRVTDDPRPSFRRWHPRRDRSKSVLASNAGTILLSGPRTANASFGTPRGHSLTVGPPESCSGARSAMDTLPRTKLVSRYCANRHPLLGDRACTRETSYHSCLRYFVGSYSSPLFHIERAIAASLRASVNFARLGFVPAVSIRW